MANVTVDHDVTVDQLVESWINGNRSWVIDNLKYRHPAITAMFIVEGSRNGLKESDCNSITNMLMDDMVKVRDKWGLEFTGRPANWGDD